MLTESLQCCLIAAIVVATDLAQLVDKNEAARMQGVLCAAMIGECIGREEVGPPTLQGL